MAGEKAKGGKKQRKFGRHTRSGSGKAYKGELRWSTNRAARIKRDAASKEAKAKHLKARAEAKKPQRGCARNKRRLSWLAVGGRAWGAFSKFVDTRAA